MGIDAESWWFGLAAFVFGVLLFGPGLYQVHQHRWLLRKGAPARGRVIEVIIRPGNGHILYAPKVQFTTEHGRAVVARSRLYAQRTDVRAGDVLGLRYDPGDPERVLVDGFHAARSRWILTLAGAFLIAVAGVAWGTGAI